MKKKASEVTENPQKRTTRQSDEKQQEQKDQQIKFMKFKVIFDDYTRKLTLNPAQTTELNEIKSIVDSLKNQVFSTNFDNDKYKEEAGVLQRKYKTFLSGISSGSGSPGDVANTSTPTPTPTPTQSVSGSASAPPSVGTDSDTIKVEFQALYDNAYTEIKQCFCQGMANLFNDAFIPSTEHVYEALNKALYVDVVDKNSGGIASQINPDYETVVGDQIEKIMKFIMTNPDPQIKIDIRKNLSGGCNISQEHHQASITRGKPTAIVGGSTYKHLAKNKKTYTQKKPHKKSM